MEKSMANGIENLEGVGVNSDECAIPMVRRFHSPSNGNGLFWHSFDVAPIHVIYISTEHDFCRSSIQYLWLENDLSSVNRSRTP
ncbi:unnamed protein product [Rotaria magnacalcarata]|uniref:Uncharacterized protein n=2 Tax=Rotaria magnacalcarata TaxID=392030 RepID=A0A8S3CIZ1_9BILA|nr:unnamed protein product [Rotaria magnacalcarata]